MEIPALHRRPLPPGRFAWPRRSGGTTTARRFCRNSLPAQPLLRSNRSRRALKRSLVEQKVGCTRRAGWLMNLRRQVGGGRGYRSRTRIARIGERRRGRRRMTEPDALKKPPRQRRKLLRFLFRASLFLVLLLVACGGILYFWASSPSLQDLGFATASPKNSKTPSAGARRSKHVSLASAPARSRSGWRRNPWPRGPRRERHLRRGITHAYGSAFSTSSAPKSYQRSLKVSRPRIPPHRLSRWLRPTSRIRCTGHNHRVDLNRQRL